MVPIHLNALFISMMYVLSAGDVLPGSVHHPEAAVRPEAAAHRPLRPGCTGAGAWS